LKRFKEVAKTGQEVAKTTFGEMLEEIIEPQVHTAMIRNPKLMKSESVSL
jgi:hypothetical protein